MFTCAATDTLADATETWQRRATDTQSQRESFERALEQCAICSYMLYARTCVCVCVYTAFMYMARALYSSPAITTRYAACPLCRIGV